MANKKEAGNYLSDQYIDLVSEKLGGQVLWATDDFFAEKENLIKPGRGIFIPDKYTERGKWMDGWESRRKRTEGHDWCVLKLATPGTIKGFDIDTNHFLGNHPPHASVEAVLLSEDPENTEEAYAALNWTEILPKSDLDPGSQHLFDAQDQQRYSHVRLHIFPDGGVARFRVYGEVWKDWTQVPKEEIIDLASALNGAKAVACNDMFFSDMGNLLNPGRGVNMGDGWETKRNRTPNNVDWCVIRLAKRGLVESVLLDTCHFKGNYPDRFSLEGCDATELEDWSKAEWKPLLAQQKLEAHKEHIFSEQLGAHEPVTHVRLNIYPDGGVSRLRLFGRKTD